MRLWPTKRGWKRLGIGLAILVAIALIANGALAWWAEWRLDSRLDAIRESGAPASIAELEPEPIRDGENAAAILQEIRPRLEEFGKDYGRFFTTPLGKAYDEAQDRGEPATAEQTGAIRAILDKYPDVEQAIARAANCEHYASQLDYSLNHTEFLGQLLEVTPISRTAARFLAWRGEVLLADGQHEQAVECGLQLLRIARLSENEPTLMAYLVAIATQQYASNIIYDAMAAGPISPDLHASLDDELARQNDPQRLARVLKSERAVNADWIKTWVNGEYAVLVHLLGWQLKGYQAGVLDAMKEQIAIVAQPWHKMQARLQQVDSQVSQHGVLAELLVPAIKAAYHAHARSLAVSRSLRIFNALRQYAEEQGREAEGLADLNLPEAATIDPYSGEPLKLKLTDDGWVIYSVMENGTDDGGDFSDQKDYGVAPRAGGGG
jgi:hypothetical protein